MISEGKIKEYLSRRRRQEWKLTLRSGIHSRAALQIHDRSPKARPVASLNQSQAQLTRPDATGLGMQRAPGQMCHALVCRRTEPAGSTMPLISLELSDTLHTFRQVQPHFLGMKIFSQGGVSGAQHP